MVTGSDFHDPPSVKRAKEIEAMKSGVGRPALPGTRPPSAPKSVASGSGTPGTTAKSSSHSGVIKGVDSKMATMIMDNMVDQYVLFVLFIVVHGGLS